MLDNDLAPVDLDADKLEVAETEEDQLSDYWWLACLWIPVHCIKL